MSYRGQVFLCQLRLFRCSRDRIPHILLGDGHYQCSTRNQLCERRRQLALHHCRLNKAHHIWSDERPFHYKKHIVQAYYFPYRLGKVSANAHNHLAAEAAGCS